MLNSGVVVIVGQRTIAALIRSTVGELLEHLDLSMTFIVGVELKLTRLREKIHSLDNQFAQYLTTASDVIERRLEMHTNSVQDAHDDLIFILIEFHLLRE